MFPKVNFPGVIIDGVPKVVDLFLLVCHALVMGTLKVSEIDGFISGYKTLVGVLPSWNNQYNRYLQTRWGIQDADGIERGELCFSCRVDGNRPSISCMYQQNLIYRLDVAPEGECKNNSFMAIQSGLPHEVCGSHVHGWLENRGYIDKNGFSQLPNRRSIDGLVETFSDGLGWVAEDLNIHITPEQRDFDLPPTQLF